MAACRPICCCYAERCASGQHRHCKTMHPVRNMSYTSQLHLLTYHLSFFFMCCTLSVGPLLLPRTSKHKSKYKADLFAVRCHEELRRLLCQKALSHWSRKSSNLPHCRCFCCNPVHSTWVTPAHHTVAPATPPLPPEPPLLPP